MPERPLDGKTFLLGVGAQKAGTTWLYAYLRQHPECSMPLVKELHVFDSAFLPELYRTFHTDAVRRLLSELDRGDSGGAIAPSAALHEARSAVAAQIDPARYPEIFAARDPAARLTGELTPEYAALPADAFARVRDLLIESGARPRVVFLMRDPVERLYSSARMWARRTGTETVDEIFATLRQNLGNKAHMGRARYDRTIKALEAAFPAEELYFGFYETHFTDDALAGLCGFLGISVAPADFSARHNVTRRPGDLPEDIAAEARKALDPVYRFCRQRFGAQVPDTWMD